jgi:hypothetical protein
MVLETQSARAAPGVAAKTAHADTLASIACRPKTLVPPISSPLLRLLAAQTAWRRKKRGDNSALGDAYTAH